MVVRTEQGIPMNTATGRRLTDDHLQQMREFLSISWDNGPTRGVPGFPVRATPTHLPGIRLLIYLPKMRLRTGPKNLKALTEENPGRNGGDKGYAQKNINFTGKILLTVSFSRCIILLS